MKSCQVKELKVKELKRFCPFATGFILNQFLDYPLKIRRKYIKDDFDRRKLRGEIKNGRRIILTASEEKEFIGFASFYFERGGGVVLQWLGVDKNRRCRGVGSRILEEVAKKAKEHHCHFIVLSTENENNIKYYQKRGFYLVGLHKEAWYGVDENLMQKNICRPFPIEE